MRNYDTGTKWAIAFISVAIPVVVGFLIFQNSPGKETSGWVYMLPHINGMINSFTVLILIFGYVMIRKGLVGWHRTAMITAFILGIFFFISYIIYHANVPSQVFGDINNNSKLEPAEVAVLGYSRIVYLSFLLTHIGFATILAPFILLALYYALTGKLEKHKKIVRFALPVWMYVCISGVVVYLMISTYY